jgi:DNA-binding NtrC family response regulator
MVMKLTSEIAHLNAQAFLYDHLMDFPVWFRNLTRGQLEKIARIMIEWSASLDGSIQDQSTKIVPMQEIEKREVIRAVVLCRGDVMKAAEALQMGKTTVYKRLKHWGYSIDNHILTHQASVLAHLPQKKRAFICSPEMVPHRPCLTSAH